MADAYLFFNYNSIYLCEISFPNRWGYSKLTTSEWQRKILLCVVFIGQINHYGKLMVLHKSILIVLQLTNQINEKISREIVRCQGYFLKLV